jgi:hypothetical protein
MIDREELGITNLTSTAVKSKVKSQKSKVLWSKLFRDFKWVVYLRRPVLGAEKTEEEEGERFWNDLDIPFHFYDEFVGMK